MSCTPIFLKLKLSRKDLHCQYCREEYDKMQKDPEILLSPRESVAVTLASSIMVLLVPVKRNRTLILQATPTPEETGHLSCSLTSPSTNYWPTFFAVVKV